MREGHGVRVVNPNTQLKEAFASKKGLSESTTEVPSVSDLEELLGAKIFEEFSPTDVSTCRLENTISSILGILDLDKSLVGNNRCVCEI